MKRLHLVLGALGVLCASVVSTATAQVYSAGQTIDLKFTTRNAGGVPTAFAASPTPVVSIYKSNGTTETTTGAVTTPTFDAKTGLNNLRITTTDDTSFYTNGNSYSAVITTGTVDGVSVVGETVANFRLEVNPLAAAYGCNKVLEVGSGQLYTTITAAEAAASAGDLILVHPGTYSETGYGKNDITYYLAYGATLTSVTDEHLFDPVVARFRVLGRGKLVSGGDDSPIYLPPSTTSDPDVSIECDIVDSTNNTWTSVFGCDDADARIAVKANRIVAGATPILANATTGVILIECTGDIILGGTAAKVTSANNVVAIKAKNIRSTNANLIDTAASAGRVILDANINMTHATTNGINAPTGVTVVLEAGSLAATTGRPSLSGAGTHLVSGAFNFNFAASTASNLMLMPSNAVAWAGGKIPTQNETGVPEVDVTHILGVSASPLPAPVETNLEAFFDGPGYGPLLFHGAISNVDSQTQFDFSGAQNNSAYPAGCQVSFYNPTAGGDGGAARSVRTLVSYAYDDFVSTVVVSSAPDFTITAGTIIDILPP